MALIWAYRCSRTGLYYPDDYIEQWGQKYGRGLGTEPVSEALVNNYKKQPARGRDGKLAHPIANCRAQVDHVQVEESVFNDNRAILHINDRDYKNRGELMYHKGIVKSGSRAGLLQPELIPLSREFLDKRRSINSTTVQEKIN